MAAQLKADSTQSFCEGTLGWHRKRWIVCLTDIGLAGLISGENYALWLALFGSRPGASYELMLLDCTLLSDLQTWLLKAREYNPKTFKIGTPSELQQTLLALWAANELAGRPAADADLLAWGGDIGSDISVFFSSGCAYCTGR